MFEGLIDFGFGKYATYKRAFGLLDFTTMMNKLNLISSHSYGKSKSKIGMILRQLMSSL